MFKKIIRALLFTFVTVYLLDMVLGVLSYVQSDFFIIVVALAIFHMLIRPLLSMLGFPSKGFSFFVIKSVLFCILLFIFVTFVPLFFIKPMHLTGITIVGFDLPEISLVNFWSTVVYSVLFTTIFGFFDWICDTSGK